MAVGLAVTDAPCIYKSPSWPRWWAAVDSNHLPPRYQHGALPVELAAHVRPGAAYETSRQRPAGQVPRPELDQPEMGQLDARWVGRMISSRISISKSMIVRSWLNDHSEL